MVYFIKNNNNKPVLIEHRVKIRHGVVLKQNIVCY